MLLLYGLVWLARLFWFQPADIRDFYERIAYAQAALDPEGFSLLPPATLDQLNAARIAFRSRGPEQVERVAELAAQQLATLKGYEAGARAPEVDITKELVAHWLEERKASAEFADQYAFKDLFDPEADPMFFLLYRQPVFRDRGAKAFLARLRMLGDEYAKQPGLLDSLRGRGFTPARFHLRALIRRLDSCAALQADEHPLYDHFAGNLVQIPRLSVGEFDKLDYLTAAEERLREEVLPALKRVLPLLERMLEEAPAGPVGLHALPEGAAFYQHLLRTYSGTRLAPPVLHEMGKVEVNQAQAELRLLLDSLGESSVNWQERLQQLARSGDTLPQEGLENPYLLAYQQAVNTFQPKIMGLFDSVPDARLEVWEQAACWHRPQVICSPLRAGEEGDARLYLPISDPRLWQHPLRSASVFRDAVPGRYFQQNLAQQQTQHPPLRRIIRYPYFEQGWALYAQQLAYEFGLSTDLWVWVDKAQHQLLAAALLVIDTGIHHQGWEPAKAVDYLQTQVGLSVVEAEQWVEEVVLRPGALGMGILGFRTLMDLRAEARQALGGDFFLRGFHNWLMRQGALPEPLLKQAFATYLQAQKAPGEDA